MRPPWAVAEDRFVEACNGCGECIPICPERILRVGRGGLPEVSFAGGECTFCEACAEACATGALAFWRADDPTARRPPWNVRARISNACLSLTGITCRVCGDRCDVGAIAFRLAVGGVAVPVIDDSLCTGCGACCGPCPANAVEIR